MRAWFCDFAVVFNGVAPLSRCMYSITRLTKHRVATDVERHLVTTEASGSKENTSERATRNEKGEQQRGSRKKHDRNEQDAAGVFDDNRQTITAHQKKESKEPSKRKPQQETNRTPQECLTTTVKRSQHTKRKRQKPHQEKTGTKCIGALETNLPCRKFDCEVKRSIRLLSKT
jgi:hypothetical protein